MCGDQADFVTGTWNMFFFCRLAGLADGVGDFFALPKAHAIAAGWSPDATIALNESAGRPSPPWRSGSLDHALLEFHSSAWTESRGPRRSLLRRACGPRLL